LIQQELEQVVLLVLKPLQEMVAVAGAAVAALGLVDQLVEAAVEEQLQDQVVQVVQVQVQDQPVAQLQEEVEVAATQVVKVVGQVQTVQDIIQVEVAVVQVEV
jgi:hypothetical protein